ncbi:hypothetical protein GALMADRAFT_250216 [Galerina marginata CBS 339.88]|uniref:Peptidase C14 caspase domain-containing protein n=1 Tax=Galerina marginata (strain CBS 339.88) TaxID=685588 RepID=A0A067T344_GALM3|nr:hypothetical protein GALMADRAFT_250216 [Galerina marginata CBS 339.88]
MDPSMPLRPEPMFLKRLFEHFVKVFASSLRPFRSLGWYHQAEQGQPSVFRRIFLFLNKTFAPLLSLPGWRKNRRQRKEEAKQNPDNQPANGRTPLESVQQDPLPPDPNASASLLPAPVVPQFMDPEPVISLSVLSEPEHMVPPSAPPELMLYDSPSPSTRVARKKALLIGVKESVEVAESDPETAVEPKQSSSLPHKSKRNKSNASSSSRKNSTANSPHRDVKALHALLQDVYGYAPEDITILIDVPNEIQPTRENILLQIRKLIEGARDDDRFFFHFSGHSGQVKTDDPKEEDGLDEYIITSDRKRIMDNELRESLVDPLPSTCSLIAIFDSCHSGTLLDLPHFRCNRVYVPWVNKGHRKTKTRWANNVRQPARIPSHSGIRLNTPPPTALVGTSIGAIADQILDIDLQSDVLANALEDVQQKIQLSIVTCFSQSNVFDDDPTTSWQLVSSPSPTVCEGYCRGSSKQRQASVPQDRVDIICLSSSDDSQLTWEDNHGNSMTQFLVNILSVSNGCTVSLGRFRA